MRILIAEDSQTQAVDLRRRLEGMGHKVTVAPDGLQAWNLLRSKPEPLVISDWMMPEMNGLELCRKIRGELKIPYVYVILLTAKTHRHERLQALNAGADDFLSKPIDSIELEVALKTAQRIISVQEALQARTRELERTNDELARLAASDDLTGLKNQRGFQDSLASLMRQAQDDGLPLSLIRLEIDQVEEVLRGIGSAGLLELLAQFADRLRAQCRECDIPARVGEHEFALLLPALAAERVRDAAELLRGAVADIAAPLCQVGASVGIATWNPACPGGTSARLFEDAGAALRSARAEGGDRVATHAEASSPAGIA